MTGTLSSQNDRQPRLIAVRHGATEWSTSRRHTGWTDLPLDPQGVQQAIDVGKRLAGHDFRQVLTSPLERARVTCELAGFGGIAKICDDLREWNYGEMEGRTTAEIREQIPGWNIWADGVIGGETIDQVRDRADRVIAQVRGGAGDVLAFAHAHIFRVIAARWVGLGPTAGQSLALSPATVSVLGWERETPVIEVWNDGSSDLF
ncbi:MAG: histidine phosphatase family protein [Acidimicrobiales bacterium]